MESRRPCLTTDIRSVDSVAQRFTPPPGHPRHAQRLPLPFPIMMHRCLPSAIAGWAVPVLDPGDGGPAGSPTNPSSNSPLPPSPGVCRFLSSALACQNVRLLRVARLSAGRQGEAANPAVGEPAARAPAPSRGCASRTRTAWPGCGACWGCPPGGSSGRAYRPDSPLLPLTIPACAAVSSTALT